MILEILQPNDLTQSEWEAYFEFMSGGCVFLIEQAY